jgi:hypothetical protein
MAATGITHWPVNAPVLLVDATPLCARLVTEETCRLKPDGVGLPAQVFVVGPVPERTVRAVGRAGFSIMRIGNDDPFDTAAEVASFRASLDAASGSTARNLMIVSGEGFEYGLPAPAYTAHHGAPILFAHRTGVPAPTLRFLAQHSCWNVFVVAPPVEVPESVLAQLSAATSGIVDRIPGFTPFEMAVSFAMYRRPDVDFGWGMIHPMSGQAFSFAPVREWQFAVAGGLNGHLGKHTPVLTVNRDDVPPAILGYLDFLNPVRPAEPHTPLMHGLILGSEVQVSWAVQVKLEEHLQLPDPHWAATS